MQRGPIFAKRWVYSLQSGPLMVSRTELPIAEGSQIPRHFAGKPGDTSPRVPNLLKSLQEFGARGQIQFSRDDIRESCNHALCDCSAGTLGSWTSSARAPLLAF